MEEDYDNSAEQAAQEADEQAKHEADMQGQANENARGEAEAAMGQAEAEFDVETYKELITILQKHVGETGQSEGAVEVLERLLKEHKCLLGNL
jgi:membrane protein involved in colicin uptake